MALQRGYSVKNHLGPRIFFPRYAQKPLSFLVFQGSLIFLTENMGKVKRLKHSAFEIEFIVKSFLTSKESAITFAASQGIPIRTFKRWLQ